MSALCLCFLIAWVSCAEALPGLHGHVPRGKFKMAADTEILRFVSHNFKAFPLANVK